MAGARSPTVTEASAFEASWDAFGAEQDRWVGRMALVIGIVSQPLWTGLDFLTQPDLWSTYVWGRVAFMLLCALYLVVLQRLEHARHTRSLILSAFLFGGSAAAVTVPLAGEYYALYVLGFSLMVWAGGCILAWSMRWSLTVFGSLFLIFCVAHAAVDTSQSPITMVVSTGYVLTAIFLCVGSSVWRFESNRKIHQANWALATRNRELAEYRLEVVEARAITQTKNAFMERMSHELRTPLNAILGYTELVREELEDAERSDLACDLDKVTHAGNHLVTLVDDILNLSAIEAGQVPFDPKPFDLAGLASSLVAEIAPAAVGKRLSIHCEGADVPIFHDPARVRQVLVALLSNAVKFTETGSVHLEVGLHRDRVRVDVRDTGPGIRAQDLGRIFESFQQGDGSRTRRHEGSGLGLAVARGLARSMGGDLTVISKVDEGCLFTLEMPVSLVQEGALPLLS